MEIFGFYHDLDSDHTDEEQETSLNGNPACPIPQHVDLAKLGLAIPVMDTSGNVLLLDIWSASELGPYMQASSSNRTKNSKKKPQS